MRKHLIIPDTQVRPDVNISHLEWIGNYIMDKRPDVVVHLGDHYDMYSLNEYDKVRKPKAFHNASYASDLAAGDRGFDLLTKPMRKSKAYKPYKVYLIGNHEERAIRLVNLHANMAGALRMPWEYAADLGWNVMDYLEPIEIDGVWYCHYFYNPSTGKPWGGDSRFKLGKLHHSFTMGHVQGLDQTIQSINNGRRLRGLVAGSCYLHNEEYRGPQAKNEWRGILVKHQVADGDYDLMEVSLQYLEAKYG